jgi:hypothetical protein
MMLGETRRLTSPRLILDPVDAYRLRTAFGAPDDLETLDDTGWERLAIRLGGLWPRPASPIRLFLVERLEPQDMLGTGVALEPPVELRVCPSASGYLLFFDLVRASGTPDDRRGGARRRSGLAAGDYALDAKSALFQPLTTRVTLAAGDEGAKEAQRLLLEPGFSYPFADGLGSLPTLLFGELRADDPADLDGLRVQALEPQQGAPATPPYRVERRGEWALVIDDAALTYDPNGVAHVTVDVRRRAQTIHSVDDVPVQRRRGSRLAPVQLPGS